MKLENRGAADKDTMENVGHDIAGEDRIEAGMLEERQFAMAASEQDRALETITIMEEVVKRANLNAAFKRVVANKGSAGFDNMHIDELDGWLRANKGILIEQLLNGTYQPQPIRRVDIPKPNGGTRQLGIPTVVDRLVQQAILQVLTRIIDPLFSNSSYGFRPNRSAHQALQQAQKYVAEGRWIVVDIDIEKFFDCVNHDILMSRLARHIEDKRLLKIVRRFLQAGIMENGVCIRKEEGTPQGGPLSPLLANLLLNDLDKELEKRGHKFCRYADDCNIYVGSLEAGKRAMESIAAFLEKKLRLRINREKSEVAPSRHQIIPGISAAEVWNACYSKEKHPKSKAGN